MPALVNSSVGSLPGTSELDGTTAWPLLAKELEKALPDFGRWSCGSLDMSGRLSMAGLRRSSQSSMAIVDLESLPSAARI